MTGTAGFSVYPVGQQAAAQWVQTKYEIEFKSLRLANFTVTLLNILNMFQSYPTGSVDNESSLLSSGSMFKSSTGRIS